MADISEFELKKLWEEGAEAYRARRSSVNFRNAERFGMIKIINEPIKFWFEEMELGNSHD